MAAAARLSGTIPDRLSRIGDRVHGIQCDVAELKSLANISRYA